VAGHGPDGVVVRDGHGRVDHCALGDFGAVKGGVDVGIADDGVGELGAEGLGVDCLEPGGGDELVEVEGVGSGGWVDFERGVGFSGEVGQEVGVRGCQGVEDAPC